MEQLRLETVEFEGRNNAYLLGREPGAQTTLIDTGVATAEVETNLRETLGAYDLAFADIDQVFLTHYHYDHAGLAGIIQRESGATVWGHPLDIPMMGGSADARETFFEAYEARLPQWNLPPDTREELDAFLRNHRHLSGEPIDVTPLESDSTYSVGRMEISPISLPGHTLGHVGYRVDDGPLFSGDALLPVYTPNIGGADLRVEDPLGVYLDTLQTIVTMDPPVVWPGHRDRIDDAAGRAREIRLHHRDRTQRVIDVLHERGPMDVWSMATALFGSLSGIHILHGPGEASAHLRHLVNAGVAAETEGGYRLTDPEADADTLVSPLT